jgi:retron-type reverse transcriptase
VAKQQPERRFTLLYDKVCRQDILQEAWQRVRSNKGAAGVDEVAIDEIREYGEVRFLGEIAQELRDGSYRVSLVRRVHIPKPGQPGKTRPLGIPTVKDRVIQQPDLSPDRLGRAERVAVVAPTQTPMHLAVCSEALELPVPV